jgi:hypothetical protein
MAANSGRAPSGQALVASDGAASVSTLSGFDPSRLEAWWPIPINKDNEGLFCDLASEGAATGLLALVTGISEECWCASWMSGIEFELWRAREFGPEGTYATQRQADLLRLLSDEAEGWWYWVDGKGPRFTPLDSWRDYVAALARAATGNTDAVHEGAGLEEANPPPRQLWKEGRSCDALSKHMEARRACRLLQQGRVPSRPS